MKPNFQSPLSSLMLIIATLLICSAVTAFSPYHTPRQYAPLAPPLAPPFIVLSHKNRPAHKSLSNYQISTRLLSTPIENDSETTIETNPIIETPHDENTDSSSSSISGLGIRKRLKSAVSAGTKPARSIAKKVETRLVRPLTPTPGIIGAVLRDAAAGAADDVIKLVGSGTSSRQILESPSSAAAAAAGTTSNATSRLLNAFASAEDAVAKAERAVEALAVAKEALAAAKEEALAALLEVEEVSAAAAGASVPLSPATLEPSVLTDIADLSYEDIDFSLSEMAPPFIGDDQCLVPGVPLVRVEKAPENSRRIFAGIDIMASVDDVWKALTDYARLQDIVPNLVLNEVMELYDGDGGEGDIPSSIPDEEQAKILSTRMKGAKLRQVGGAKVVGINFSARTTLEVREWPNGLPDFAHFNDDVYDGKSRNKRIQEGKKLPLKRYAFPRPFAISRLPTKDISMQSVPDDDGEFRMYQGVWRMQPLPGCGSDGKSAMRLTYAVEISPRAYLPVQLVEKRIASDLCNNLEAIRDAVTSVPAVVT